MVMSTMSVKHEPRCKKSVFGVRGLRCDTNRHVQSQKIGSLKFRDEVLYHLCSKNKDADQLCTTAQLICVFIFAKAKIWFSHDATHMVTAAML